MISPEHTRPASPQPLPGNPAPPRHSAAAIAVLAFLIPTVLPAQTNAQALAQAHGHDQAQAGVPASAHEQAPGRDSPAPAPVQTLSPIHVYGISNDDLVTDGKASYSIKATGAGTGLRLSLRDTPQSVTIVTQQRIQDQNMASLTEAMASTPGVSSQHYDSERYSFSARGFQLDNYQHDGIPTAFSTGYYSGEASIDPIILDRIEVVRGATGLLSGAGNPGVAVNLVHKRATSKSLAARVSAAAGSWDTYRATMDISSPLNAAASVRGRAVAAYTDRNSHVDRYHNRQKVFFGTVEADLSDATNLRLGYSFQGNSPTGTLWGGFPLWYSDGERTDWPRSLSTAARWSSWATTTQNAFARLEHRFDNGWQVDGLLSHNKNAMDARLLYLHQWPDRSSGLGMKATTGNYFGDTRQTSLDIKASGPFHLLGRKHELIVGSSVARTQIDYKRRRSLGNAPVGSLLAWDGSYPEPRWDPAATSSLKASMIQQGLYAAARLNLADPVRLIAGGRYSKWERDVMTGASPYQFSKAAFLPYLGLLVDLDDTLTAYAAYTSIFNPQEKRDRNGRWLDPLDGSSYEVGLKGEYFDGRLNTAIALFQVDQDNFAEQDTGHFVPGTTQAAYRATRGTRSRGYEIEVNGEPSDSWKLSAGLTHWTARDARGQAVQTSHPRTLLRLFTTYRLPGAWHKVTAGAGVDWQSRTYTVATGPRGAERVSRPAYALVNLMARYQHDKHLQLQVNLNNLFDKKYYQQLGFYSQGAWGAPRSVMATLSYQM